jgi:hypothetical protein
MKGTQIRQKRGRRGIGDTSMEAAPSRAIWREAALAQSGTVFCAEREDCWTRGAQTPAIPSLSGTGGKTVGSLKESSNVLAKNKLIEAALLVVASTSGASAANSPTTLAGSVWSGDANGMPLTLSVTTEGGGGTCLTIIGTFSINGNASAPKSYYCPSSGTVVAFRSLNGQTFHVFSGATSQSPDPSPLGYECPERSASLSALGLPVSTRSRCKAS